MKNQNKNAKQLLKVIIPAICIALAVVFATVTLAWWTINVKVKSGGTMITITAKSGINTENVMILKREGTDGAKDVASLGSITLTEYDTVFMDKNVNTPIIMRIQLSGLPKDEEGNYADIQFSIACSNDKTTGEWKEWISKKENWGLNRCLSNIVYLCCGIGDKTLNDKTALDDIYLSAVAFLSENATNNTYVNYTKSGSVVTVDFDTKKEQLDFTLKNYSSLVVDNSYIVLYVEINYDANLISAYIKQHDIEVGSDLGKDSIMFESDILNFKFITEVE